MATVAGGSAGKGVEKKMRKGTKSCFACRRRKTRCIYQGNQDTCSECLKRPGSVCTPQGVVADDNEGVSYAKREKLAHRVARLESMLAKVPPDMIVQDADDAAVSKLKRDLDDGEQSGVHENVIESSAAPLMHLMQSSMVGAEGVKEANSPNETQRSACNIERERIVDQLLASLPSGSDLRAITMTKGEWWPLWRHTSGLVWGEADCTTLVEFATRTLQRRHPGLIGILLVSLAIATGDMPRFLPPVERLVAHDDRIAGSEYGLGCLVALALCYLNNLQPRRAWALYRRALTLLQLNNIHMTHRKSAKQDHLFWQLFHADRWVSLMIGLPYMLPDDFCDLDILSIEESSIDSWLHRKLIVVTGKIIDCIQHSKGPVFSTAIQTDELLNNIMAPLPEDYLSLKTIQQCTGVDKAIRAYRAIQFHQLKVYLHLPFLLRSPQDECYGYSRMVCNAHARRLLDAYTHLYEADSQAVTNGTLLNFNAFVAAVIVMLHLLGYAKSNTDGRPRPEDDSADWALVQRTQNAIHAGIDGISSTLCKQCHQALESLISSTHDLDPSATRQVVLPYFGTLSIKRSSPRMAESSIAASASSSVPPPVDISNAETTGASRATGSMNAPWHEAQNTLPYTFTAGQMPVQPYENISLAYQGPYFTDPSMGSWLPNAQSGVFDNPGFDASFTGAWDFGSADTMDWSWFNADVPFQS